jgi:hypothetical protein
MQLSRPAENVSCTNEDVLPWPANDSVCNSRGTLLPSSSVVSRHLLEMQCRSAGQKWQLRDSDARKCRNGVISIQLPFGYDNYVARREFLQMAVRNSPCTSKTGTIIFSQLMFPHFPFD